MPVIGILAFNINMRRVYEGMCHTSEEFRLNHIDKIFITSEVEPISK
jgi:hypothetical protein